MQRIDNDGGCRMGTRGLAALLLGLGLLTGAAGVRAQADERIDTGASNLLPVLRPSAGAHHERETLVPFGRLKVTLPDGRDADIETSWFHYLGDMHVRLVFDGAQTLQSASPDDLARLKLSPREAVQLAVANLRRAYGVPVAQPWSGNVMQVQGGAADLNSSYLLDREFWRELEGRHPAGLVVAVPRRGGLVFVPADDAEGLAQLRFSAAALYASGERSRVSASLYLFRDGQWSVFRPPAP